MNRRVKKRIALLLVFAMTATCLAGCGKSNSGDEQNVGSLNVLIWDGNYAEEVWEDFEEETGIHVNVSYITSTDEILAKLVSGNADYDYIDLESAYIKSFVDNGLLAEIDQSKIPNMKYLKEGLDSPVGDEDNRYTIPASSDIYTCIVYNKETCPIEITSFADLADPKLKGDLCMVNSTISLFGVALESLGYEASSSNEDEIAEAYKILTEIKPNVKAFAGESCLSQLENGECSVALFWDYPLLMMNPDNWDKFAIAEIDSGYEKSNGFIAIPASSKKKQEAEQLINFVLKPEEQAKSLATSMAEPAELQEVMEPLLGEEYYKNPAFHIPQSVQDQAWHIAIDDTQIDIMDTYYTKLMSDQ